MEIGGWAGKHIRSLATHWKEFPPLVLPETLQMHKATDTQEPTLLCAWLLSPLTD